MGDINGIIQKLDYFKEIGVNLLWLTPIYVSLQNDNGYDVADYYNVNPDYGTMENVENLITKADKLGIKIMFDMVLNHTSTEHEWFQNALSGDKKYQGYY